MGTYNFYPTLLNSFHEFVTEKKLGENFLLCSKEQLLDKINRVPYPTTEPMAKGNAFEHCLRYEGVYEKDGFSFDKELIERMRPMVKGGAWQLFVETTIDVDGHQVRHYGYLDVVRRFQTIDVKTTSQYQWPKFDGGYQHHVYLLGASDAGAQLSEHMYLITDFKDYYTEVYPFKRDLMINQLRTISRDLISFLENNRHLITDKKIFGL